MRQRCHGGVNTTLHPGVGQKPVCCRFICDVGCGVVFARTIDHVFWEATRQALRAG
jgi:hypothetical protein